MWDSKEKPLTPSEHLDTPEMKKGLKNSEVQDLAVEQSWELSNRDKTKY